MHRVSENVGLSELSVIKRKTKHYASTILQSTRFASGARNGGSRPRGERGDHVPFFWQRGLSKVVPYSITSIGLVADLGFLAVSPQE